MGGREQPVAVRAAGIVARGALYARLSAGVSAGVTLISAPPGSGKTVLLRSWLDEAGLRPRTAWLQVERHERDAQHFQLSAVERLRWRNADLAAFPAYGEVIRPLLDTAATYIAVAERDGSEVPEERRRQHRADPCHPRAHGGDL